MSTNKGIKVYNSNLIYKHLAEASGNTFSKFILLTNLPHPAWVTNHSASVLNFKYATRLNTPKSRSYGHRTNHRKCCFFKIKMYQLGKAFVKK